MSAEPRAHGPPLGSARLRARAEDFQVCEELGFTPSGEGEHLFLRVRKRDWTTVAAARAVGEWLGVAPRRVAYAGLKDRHAVAEQWLSAAGAGLEAAPGPVAEGLEVVAVTRNRRQLRRGALHRNHFRLWLRAVEAPERALDARLAGIARAGVPNYFGPQRFAGGRNLARGRAWLAGGSPPGDKALRGLLLSAARSWLFNRLLARRVADGTWARLLPGERVILDGRTSHFPLADDDPTLPRRVATLRLHPSGPLPGVPGDDPVGEVAALEAEVIAAEPELVAGLQARGVRAARRALRLRVAGLAWRHPEPGVLELSFALAPGGYATSVVREIVETRE